MANPAILVVDDDAGVLNAVERDLRRKFGREYRIIKANSGTSALEIARELQKRNEIVALLLSDQRMPQMTGLEFLEEASKIFPEAKRVLLTAYADTEVAISSINKLQLDYYLMKPWDPPEDNLYPVIEELLSDWNASVKLPYEGIRVAGALWSPRSHDVKDFFARHQIAYQWLDVDHNSEARAMVENQPGSGQRLPVVFYPDGTILVEPDNRELAEKSGLQIKASLPFYDLIIIGAGPAGLAGAVYAASSGINCMVLEKEAPGGQAGNSPKIENYLGFPNGISGMDLARRAVTQAKRFGAEIISTQSATGIEVRENTRVVKLSDGTEVACKAILFATGAAFRQLDLPGIKPFVGAGVYYGAAYTEAAYYKGNPVFVVGGANSAGQGAIFLTRFASKVTMLIRHGSQWSSQYLIDALKDNNLLERMFNTEIMEVHGKPGAVTGVTVMNRETKEMQDLEGAAVFAFIGADPQSQLLKGLALMDGKGFLLTGRDLIIDGKRPAGWPLERDPFILETSVPGIFAAGDVRLGTNHRVATAAGEGGVAIAAIEDYLGTL
jgi:thioredoxin reductase (NADPH)